MSNYQAPGVYSQIQTSGNKPISSLGASTAGFIGQSSIGVTNKACLVTSWSDYQKQFGGTKEGNYLAHAVYGFFLNGGNRAYICNVGEKKDNQTNEDLVSLIKGQDLGPDKRTGINVFNRNPDISLVAAPGLTDLTIHQILADHASQENDRIAILDGVQELGDLGLDEIPRIGSSPNAALYWPWISVFDDSQKKTLFVPPCGHVMGSIARVDAERGVFKAPANETIRGALNLKYTLSREEQAVLNPRGINLIRDLDDGGIRIYGARTLSTDPEWKYLNVRRLFQVVQKSVLSGTEWVVFEPNNQTLRGNIVRNIRAYLKTLYSSGALVGSTPEEAFYVQCDNANNPPESVDLGLVVIDIGIAPVKPAEFVQINIQQTQSQDEA